ncbi:MAG: elongation factor Ts [Hyphomicrobium zavarzinii]|jgi:elongation factor Ts|uniref:translation elongation factor Ts n=1 Tax=Hyphomicrobium TaxID=81 RepID=UPI0003665AD9|nr:MULTISPECIES: translation elongation factor Ts [Hyphomicrobium]MBL8844294.1 elongation factor Ts [Hyphomicrobium zavarzinii]WBT36942.1 translation elongation factor Ts [Hyphomicrobium sp. DMF-1]HML43233.1 translation elongation factor Ts [Hyphomicrobium zavarzinii]
MSTISAATVKELRDKTGAGMMDCKQALTETNGDMEAAIDLLRKKGLSKAAKKSDRVAAQGLIGVLSKVKSGAVVEVNSETDFVARNAQFQEMVQNIASLALAANGDVSKLLTATYPGTSATVDQQIKDAIATIGENMALRRTAALSVKEGVVADYVHSKAADGLGKIGVLVALESAGDTDSLMALGRQLAMHIAASNPMVVNVEDLPKEAIERERAIYVEQAKAEPKNAGKSDEILAKASEGRLQKEFINQSVLLKQVFVIDGKATVAEILKSAEKDVGAPVKVAGFVRYALGEGIEKKAEDFAAEVAKTVGAAKAG